MKTSKVCRRCLKDLPIVEFLGPTQEMKRPGWYCNQCNKERAEEWHQKALREEIENIAKLQVVYGIWWRHYAEPEYFYSTLLAERDFCPYCGTNLSEVVNPAFSSNPIHLDHMDPLFRGGEHSIRNTINCCAPCNLQKRNMSFQRWIQKIKPEMRESVRQIYIDKHGHTPEEFEEGAPVSKGGRPELVVFSTLEMLKREYPEPIVTGPPSNKPIIISLDIGRALKDFLSKKERDSGAEIQ